MPRYSAFSLLREGLRGHTGWQPVWRHPTTPKPAYDAVIIGGGGHGLATAYYLAKLHGMTRITLVAGFVIILATILFISTGSFAVAIFCSAVWGVSVIAACVQASGFALHRHFNHNDLYHVIQIAAMVLFFIGCRRLRDRS